MLMKKLSRRAAAATIAAAMAAGLAAGNAGAKDFYRLSTLGPGSTPYLVHVSRK